MNTRPSPYQIHKTMRRLRQREIGNALIERPSEWLARLLHAVVDGLHSLGIAQSFRTDP